jgi:hypothetical protein
MAKFQVIHSLTSAPEDAMSYFGKAVPELAQAMASGQAPAKCLFTWIPVGVKTGDRVVCLWEGPDADAVQAALDASGFLNYMTADIVEVEETDWGKLV